MRGPRDGLPPAGRSSAPSDPWGRALGQRQSAEPGQVGGGGRAEERGEDRSGKALGLPTVVLPSSLPPPWLPRHPGGMIQPSRRRGLGGRLVPALLTSQVRTLRSRGRTGRAAHTGRQAAWGWPPRPLLPPFLSFLRPSFSRSPPPFLPSTPGGGGDVGSLDRKTTGRGERTGIQGQRSGWGARRRQVARGRGRSTETNKESWSPSRLGLYASVPAPLP